MRGVVQVQSMGGEFIELEFKEDGSGSGGYAKVGLWWWQG